MTMQALTEARSWTLVLLPFLAGLLSCILASLLHDVVGPTVSTGLLIVGALGLLVFAAALGQLLHEGLK